MATEKKEAGGGEKTKPADESNSKILTEPNPNDAVSQQPAQEKVYNAAGDSVASEIVTNTKTDKPAEVHLNHVGQKIDTPLADATYYVTQDNKHMVVQMEDKDAGQVFAGEHGKNAEWFPKAVVDTWAKHQPVKVKAEKEKTDKKDK